MLEKQQQAYANKEAWLTRPVSFQKTDRFSQLESELGKSTTETRAGSAAVQASAPLQESVHCGGQLGERGARAKVLGSCVFKLITAS